MRTFNVALAAACAALLAAACEEQGPLEEAGEEADEAIEDAGEELEEATDRPDR